MTSGASGQRLDRILRTYRIGDPDGAFPIYSSAGSRISPGRWNTADTPIIYTAAHYSTAMLEKLADSSGDMPANQHWIEITVPPGASYEMFSSAHHGGWDHADRKVSRAYGAAWRRSQRSLLLIVPSVVARSEHNILINDAHPEFARVEPSLHQPVWWDRRLFG